MATFTPVPENVLTVVALQNTATAVMESADLHPARRSAPPDIAGEPRNGTGQR